MQDTYIPKLDYKVLVFCATYNHSKYIEDTLNGFAMQQTNFPFVCLVMDDCSTDGEQEVIMAWMERECDMEKAEYIDLELSNVILVPYKANNNCTFAFYLLNKNMYGKPEKKQLITPWRDHCEYEALCEGDDYWIDPLKLQKQVDYLDTHSNCGLVYCGRNSFIQSKNQTIPSLTEKPYENFEQLLFENYISTLTVCLRISLLNQYHYEVNPSKKKWKMGDYPIWLWFSLHSDLHYIPDVVATYRILEESASHTKNINKQIEFTKSLYDIRTYFADKSDIGNNVMKALLDEHNCAMGAIYLRWRKFGVAFSYFIKVSPIYFFKRLLKK